MKNISQQVIVRKIETIVETSHQKDLTQKHISFLPSQKTILSIIETEAGKKKRNVVKIISKQTNRKVKSSPGHVYCRAERQYETRYRASTF